MKVLNVFSGFSVPDMEKAHQFYTDVLGLSASKTPEGLRIDLPQGGAVFVYHSPTNKPAAFTVLNVAVDNVEAAVDELAAKGVKMEQYNMPDIKTDAKGIMRGDGSMGPRAIAWFKDPAGNILALIQE